MNKGIKCIPFPDIENAYIIISARESDKGNKVRKCMTFFYDSGSVGAEWEPNFGPITTLYKCPKEHKDARPHYFYDFCTGYGNRSQLAVEMEGLPEAFLNGDYVKIFAVLKRWTEV